MPFWVHARPVREQLLALLSHLGGVDIEPPGGLVTLWVGFIEPALGAFSHLGRGWVKPAARLV